jgi:hypothetical protein
MKETRKMSFVIVANEDKIKYGTPQNQVSNVSFTSACSTGHGSLCIECSEGIFVYAHVISLIDYQGFRFDSAVAIVSHNLSPQKNILLVHHVDIFPFCKKIPEHYTETL